MHTKSVLMLIIYLQIYICNTLGIYIDTNNHRCTRTGYERRTRLAPFRSMKTFTRRNWLGFVVHDRRYVTEYQLEYYYAQKTEYYCCRGYIESFGKCMPDCEDGCPMHATCIAPQSCQCDVGYKNSSSGDCAPICANGCPINAYCLLPGRCVCRSGYKRNATADTLDCLPHCSSTCPAANSECAAPEECRCRQGYRDLRLMEQPHDSEPLQCTPFCEEHCPTHSSCLRPNECVCEQGYRMQRLWQHRPYCEAQCAQDCSQFGKCVAPDVCECFAGYAMHNGSNSESNSTTSREGEFNTAGDIDNNEDNAIVSVTHTLSVSTPASLLNNDLCQPVCSGGCPHGLCVGPEVCVCNVGYLMGSNHSCEPVCSHGCQNGRCIEPEICQCGPGYRLAENSFNICLPHCTPPCINGSCIAPDFCVCWEQYVPKAAVVATELQTLQSFALVEEEAQQQHVCVPSCSEECVFGECVAPETCRCLEGYAPDAVNSTRCVPQCKRCAHGDCVAPEKCVCWEGYEMAAVFRGDCVAITTTTLATTTTFPTTISTTMMPTTTPWTWTTMKVLLTTSDATRATFKSSVNTAVTAEPSDSIHSTGITVASSEFDASPALCTTQCKCWQSSLMSHTHGTTNCVHICVDEYDQPCLQLSQCQCDAAQLRMTCPEQSTTTTNTDVTNDSLTSPLHYTCRVHIANIALTDISSMGYAPAKAQSIHSASWLLILGCIAGYSLMVILGVYTWHPHQRRYESDG